MGVGVDRPVEETDSSCDDEGKSYKTPNSSFEDTEDLPRIDKLKTLHGSPWDLLQLKGVWFLAEAEPKVKLQFMNSSPGNPEEVAFVSDVERQRWRRHLANVLAKQETGQKGNEKKGNVGWSVVPTTINNIDEIKDKTKEDIKEGHKPPALLRAEESLAIENN